MNTTLLALLSVLAVGLLTVVGMVAASLNRDLFLRSSTYLFALAAGALAANAALHMLPEAQAHVPQLWVLVAVCVAGFGFLALLDRLKTEQRLNQLTQQNFLSPVIAFFVISDSVHNFFDGAIVALAYTADVETGLFTSLAVGLHEVPLELVEWTLMLSVGLSLKRALALNLFSAVFAVLGAGLTLAIGHESEHLVYYLLPFVAGSFFYIAGLKLLPRLKVRTASQLLWHLLAAAAGVAIMLDWLHLEHHH